MAGALRGVEIASLVLLGLLVCPPLAILAVIVVVPLAVIALVLGLLSRSSRRRTCSSTISAGTMTTCRCWGIACAGPAGRSIDLAPHRIVADARKPAGQ